MRIWRCEKCGDALRAPERVRRDDVRRYCLPCSAETGRLVERVAPAVEKARARSRVESAARKARTREKAKEKALAARTAGGVDLVAEQARFARLPSLARHFDRCGTPTFAIRRSKTKWYSSGHWYSSPRRIVVTVGLDPYDAPGVVLHEMVHDALPGAHHSDRFWSALHRAAREAWPDATFDFLGAPRGWRCQRAIRDGIAGLAGLAEEISPESLTPTGERD